MAGVSPQVLAPIPLGLAPAIPCIASARKRHCWGDNEGMYKPGKELVEELTAELGPHMVWTQIEKVTLSFIEHAADRRIPLAARLDKLMADPDTPPSHLAALSSELRLTDNTIHKWIATLDPNDNQAKSARHVHAANQRWHPNRGS